jgi:hypothetical protein
MHVCMYICVCSGVYVCIREEFLTKFSLKLKKASMKNESCSYEVLGDELHWKEAIVQLNQVCFGPLITCMN